MKIDRLLRITIYLLNHGKTSSAVLADYFEVSQRTIMRDMDALCLAGIPVCSTTGVDGGYEIMEHLRCKAKWQDS
ncbi:helix-turn-helix transcriptional regulator [Candidatus Galacturonibacter soehngenii]|uniref:HTH domain-containing protein n=1 Tax=Candidatus Galacturonatibacter soehngenii TaxID=2307010 RepID=A0A7V7QLE0_9FIRM|nr:HTH domain-containing protein [Candidatus Galacturonibacter soehngenii]KAB1438376.1 HTH domain-containing protein [Candidatus Galacturonibacter soehngenii]